jgi:hypothetical protein
MKITTCSMLLMFEQPLPVGGDVAPDDPPPQPCNESAAISPAAAAVAHLSSSLRFILVVPPNLDFHLIVAGVAGALNLDAEKSTGVAAQNSKSSESWRTG